MIWQGTFQITPDFGSTTRAHHDNRSLHSPLPKNHRVRSYTPENERLEAKHLPQTSMTWGFKMSIFQGVSSLITVLHRQQNHRCPWHSLDMRHWSLQESLNTWNKGFVCGKLSCHSGKSHQCREGMHGFEPSIDQVFLLFKRLKRPQFMGHIVFDLGNPPNHRKSLTHSISVWYIYLHLP